MLKYQLPEIFFLTFGIVFTLSSMHFGPLYLTIGFVCYFAGVLLHLKSCYISKAMEDLNVRILKLETREDKAA